MRDGTWLALGTVGALVAVSSLRGVGSRDKLPEYLYHGTSSRVLPKILRQGLRALSYWAATTEMADYYAETASDEDGGDPVVIEAPFAAFDTTLLEPDWPGIEEPITTVLGKSEEDVWREWAASSLTWRASFDVIDTVRYRGKVSPKVLRVVPVGARAVRVCGSGREVPRCDTTGLVLGEMRR